MGGLFAGQGDVADDQHDHQADDHHDGREGEVLLIAVLFQDAGVQAAQNALILGEVGDVGADAGHDGAHEGEQRDPGGDAQGLQDGQHDDGDGDDGANAGHGGEDQRGDDAQQGHGDAGTVAAQLHDFTDQGGGDAGVHQDAAKEGAEEDVDQDGRSVAFRAGLVDILQNAHDAALRDGVGHRGVGDDGVADERKDRPEGGHDEEAHHQVVTLDAIIDHAQEGNDHQDANNNFGHVNWIPPYRLCKILPRSGATKEQDKQPAQD